MKITFVGDMKYGRTVHSMIKLLKLLRGIEINFVSTPSLRIPREILQTFDQNKTKETEDLKSVVEETDIFYLTRIQKERVQSAEEYASSVGKFTMTPEILKNAKSDVMVLHPMPRVDEIDHAVDNDPRAFYFKQTKYGMYVRAALLTVLLGRENLLTRQ